MHEIQSDIDLSKFQSRRYAPVGRCIYCGAFSNALTKEHIIPFGLAGNALVLPKASCQTCAAITGGSVAAGTDLAATVALKASRPITIGGSDAWTARAEEIAPGFDGDWSLTIYAICANVAA